MTFASRFLGQALKLPPIASRDIDVQRDLRVRMPDGVVLLADRYAPRTRPWPLRPPPPLVLVRSPYGRRRSWGLMFGRMFAERGFQAVIQSCRGTFGSGGTFDPFGPDEHDDGLATVAWLREQPWYPGSFGTCGPSYLGMTQWAIAADAGNDLAAIAAQVTTADFRAAFYAGGSFSLETALTWLCQADGQERPLATLRGRLAERGRRPLLNHLPLRDLDRLATGRGVLYWQDWLAHDTVGDAYWTGRVFAGTLGKVSAPVSMVSGWHDIFLPLQLRDYAALRAAGREPYLVIGPWRHADQQSVQAWLQDTLAWMRAHLAGDRAALRPQPVRVFVTGADEWRDLPAWPPEGRPHRWHLHPGGMLAQQAPPAADPDSYTYDPADPTPNLAGPVGLSGRARVDNRSLEARPDVLTYTSAPLAGDLEVAGEVVADLFVSSDREHTDFFARLCDVSPGGTSLNVCDALLRLAPGQPERQPDGTIHVRIPLWPAAHRFSRGHRLRLQVSSGAHPRYARNPGTGEPLGTAVRLVRARQQVFHDPGHPSALILPVPP
jgi:putative CocE/NonD family hydrolase